jgi:hypothetical protein
LNGSGLDARHSRLEVKLKVKMLRTVVYQNERFEKGTVIDMSDDVAERWIRHKIAENTNANPTIKTKGKKGREKKVEETE